MPVERRSADRRRRVLYSQHDPTPSTAASRRARDKLREARQPTKAYGARVHRRLRGRWFSIVPVRSSTLCMGAAIIGAVTLLLTYFHYAAVTWPSLAYRPEIARPLRLDQSGSFGRWFICVLLAASSGASLLIYQLRRYRNDDFRGHYRLWRLVIFVLLATSVNSLVSVVDWAGALLDLAFGRRVAFSGYDWLRIVLGLAGTILAIRMVADVRRSRWALLMMVAACGFLAIPEASKWQLFSVENINQWVLVTSAPLLGYTFLFLALVGYLRTLYREVRGLGDEQSLVQRWREYRASMFARDDEKSDDNVESETRKSKRRARKSESRKAVAAVEDVAVEEATEEDEEDSEEPTTRRKRRWFGLRRAKPDPSEREAADADESGEPAVEEEAQEPPRSKRKKKRRFSLRLDPNESQVDAEPEVQEADEESEPEEESPKPKRKFGLSWRKKKRDPEPVEEEESETHEPEPEAEHEPPQEEDWIDPDSVDWSTLSKSERRQLRKKLKKQRRAA